MRQRGHPSVVRPGERPRASVPAPVPRDPLAGLSAEQRRGLPNLIGIGAAKCGTSALHAYLADHPEINASARKELKVFGGGAWLEQLGWYASCFDPRCDVRTETSPTYTMDPYIPGVPEQIAATLPDPRFIYIVGDPVRRAIAHWNEHRAMAFERRSLKEAFADTDDPLNPYLATSRYGHQLGRYLSVFDAERILVVDQRDLRIHRRDALRRIFVFAGVDPEHWSHALEAEPNAVAEKLRPNRAGRWILDRGRRSAVARRMAYVRPITAGRADDVRIDANVRESLESVLAEDAAHFRTLTGLPFAHWSV